MTNEQWQQLLSVIDGQSISPIPVGFIIDSPWLPGWAGMSILDYYASETRWLDANLAAIRRFPQISFLPGFWSEYGMCTEPSAFGAKCLWHENDLPFADKTIRYEDAFASIAKPDPRTDGLCPLTLRRLVHAQASIEQAGHAIRFAVARGPLNIASFLMGATELMMAIVEKPTECHALLNTITDFLAEWLRLQKQALPSIDGIFVLDDLVGFLGEDDCVEFAKPYLKRVFSAFDAKVRFFHNDAKGLVCAPHLHDIGINFFNFSFDHSLSQMKTLTQNRVTLLGNIPPRDVLGRGTPDDVRQAVKKALDSVDDHRRIVLSAGGGMPPGVPTENIVAFLQAAGHKAE